MNNWEGYFPGGNRGLKRARRAGVAAAKNPDLNPYHRLVSKNYENLQWMSILKSINGYESGRVSKTKEGDYEVFQLDGDGQISKFIYKKLKYYSSN